MKIAITGTIASGKSTVSQMIREMGHPVFDCDACNRELLEKGNEGYLNIAKHFPECIIDGQLDKGKLAGLVFSDPVKRKKLESLNHPLIIQKMMDASLLADPFFAEVQLLFENDLDALFDVSVVVVCDPLICLDRLMKKGYELEDARLRMASQMDVSTKIKRADKVLYNNGDLEDLRASVAAMLEELGC